MAESAGQAGLGRRSRQAVARPRLVKFLLSEEELAELDAAAQRAGLARAALVAEAALVARGGAPGAGSPVREALVELMTAAGLVRRVGTNLNQVSLDADFIRYTAALQRHHAVRRGLLAFRLWPLPSV